MASQLLYIIPFVDGYAKEKKISKIIFEKILPDQIKDNPILADILSGYTIIEENEKKGIGKYFKLYINLIPLLVPSIKLAMRSTRSGLLENVTWYESQLRHAVWDQALQGVSDGLIELPLMKRIEAALRVLMAVKKGNRLYSNDGVRTAILGHTVYAGRGLLATLRLKEIDIIGHSGAILHRTALESDISHLTMPYSDWINLCRMTDDVSVEENWKDRLEGISSYSDAVNASISRQPLSLNTPKNIIFLHIFRDSPFNHIDRTRIFSDYVQWIIETFKILMESSDLWLIKIHPSSARWGEDQMAWLKSIGKSVFGYKWPKNIQIDSIGYSNIDLLKNAKRIVTYRGTVHLEAACFGIKPIIISEVSLSSFNENLVHKPKSLQEYKQLLMRSENSSCFNLDETEKKHAKCLLFIREKFLSFNRDVGDFHVFRGDSNFLHQKHFDTVLNSISTKNFMLTRIGAAMANELPRSVAFSYFDRWCRLYKLASN